MERNKRQNEEIEKLLSALENEENTMEEIQSLESDYDVIDFINAFNIAPGDKSISVASFYRYYKKWSSIPVSFKKFQGIVFRVFQKTILNWSTHILIRNDLIDLNNQIIKTEKAKKHLKKSFFIKKHLEQFINEMDITQSEDWTELQVIYKWYIKWRYRTKKIKLRKEVLKRLLCFYFESKIGTRRAFYKLKGEFNMEKINQLRGEQNEKEIKKSKGEIPSS